MSLPRRLKVPKAFSWSNTKLQLAALAIFLSGSGVIFAQTPRKDNFFKDIRSIDVSVTISGDGVKCGVTEDAIMSSASYILSNTPLKRIDPKSLDILSLGFIVLDVPSIGNVHLGCAMSTTVQLWRFVEFKGSTNLVTVWSDEYLNTGSKGQIGKGATELTEKIMKSFVSKWAAQN